MTLDRQHARLMRQATAAALCVALTLVLCKAICKGASVLAQRCGHFGTAVRL